ncbi:putative amidohydrolase [Bradyrhizobium sp. LB8.2]
MPIVKAAAVQISPVLYSREGTVGKVVKKIIELGRQGVQFATFPETVIPSPRSGLSRSDLVLWRKAAVNGKSARGGRTEVGFSRPSGPSMTRR